MACTAVSSRRFADITAYAAIAARLRHGVPRADYLRFATGMELRAIETAIKLGATIGIADVRIEDEQRRAVASGRAAFLAQRG